jgi:hypothetical protein
MQPFSVQVWQPSARGSWNPAGSVSKELDFGVLKSVVSLELVLDTTACGMVLSEAVRVPVAGWYL